MIGETRDLETAQISIQAALTGHLVLSTLHTNSAPAAVTRLLDMGIEPFLIASSVVAVIAQRLVRRLCDACRESYVPDEEIIKRLGITKEEAGKITFYKPGKCDECMQTGYRGRLAIFEIMTMTAAVARLTMERKDTIVLQEQAHKDGMTFLIEDGIRKIKEGITTVEEVLAVATTAEGITE
jgi:type II secretory ATPase GspE/PulE/Tfp pilus assembly ATPase PilB-like protein